ncbi:hypothetical protein ABZP36_011127 [Zizania latifolia]
MSTPSFPRTKIMHMLEQDAHSITLISEILQKCALNARSPQRAQRAAPLRTRAARSALLPSAHSAHSVHVGPFRAPPSLSACNCRLHVRYAVTPAPLLALLPPLGWFPPQPPQPPGRACFLSPPLGWFPPLPQLPPAPPSPSGSAAMGARPGEYTLDYLNNGHYCCLMLILCFPFPFCFSEQLNKPGELRRNVVGTVDFAVPSGGSKLGDELLATKAANNFFGCSNVTKEFEGRHGAEPNRYLMIATSGGLNQQRTGFALVMCATNKRKKLDDADKNSDSEYESDSAQHLDNNEVNRVDDIQLGAALLDDEPHDDLFKNIDDIIKNPGSKTTFEVGMLADNSWNKFNSSKGNGRRNISGDTNKSRVNVTSMADQKPKQLDHNSNSDSE